MRFCPEGITQPGDKVASGTRIMYGRRALHKGEVTRLAVAWRQAPWAGNHEGPP
jgi:hypothetical protein